MLFKRKQPSQSLFKIFSFYNHLVNPEVPKQQRAVFQKFGLSINQIFDKRFSHGGFLNSICRHVKDTDYLIFFDIDCIPTRKEWFQLLLADLLETRTIVGAAQTANHLRDARNLYVSPFFFAISTAYLKALDYPDMNMFPDMDAGQNLTEHVIRDGGNVKYWWPTEIEEDKWSLYHPEHTRFGPGTTYNDAIYHAFYSRDNLSDGFFKKCKAVLS
ncbi:hypothetical protein CLV51_1021196 [Chitinophaga niastensis]|uniref:Glycosyl transferase family 2 n=1 Tax=Chitinophaga niastensis TaxID=536980 RepID=A0A2P8HQ41_CHINA|nr:hypothetical protein [Chitinophaga niastensis]PSL48329.1 hypothetical protein CLV51_1021196 [Chitinophaga niastensis]